MKSKATALEPTVFQPSIQSAKNSSSLETSISSLQREFDNTFSTRLWHGLRWLMELPNMLGTHSVHLINISSTSRQKSHRPKFKINQATSSLLFQGAIHTLTLTRGGRGTVSSPENIPNGEENAKHTLCWQPKMVPWTPPWDPTGTERSLQLEHLAARSLFSFNILWFF